MLANCRKLISENLLVFALILLTMVGIVSYGVAIPKYRIKIADIASVWGKEAREVERGLGVIEKTVPAIDEDTVTLAVEAGKRAIDVSSIDPTSIGAVFVGSESHPYAVNPTSTIVGEYLGINRQYYSSDLQFACKAATTGLQITAGFISMGKVKHGLVIGSDTAQAKPHDILEYTASAAAGAFILGEETEKIVAELVDFVSFSSDTPDFWRRDGIAYPSHGGRFTGEPAYFAHVVNASQILLSRVKMTPSDFDYCVFHMPNGKFPKVVAKRLGFTFEQLEPSLLVRKIGNPYSASSLLGLAAVLDQAKKNQLIFLASYGSGAGSDAFIFRVRKRQKYRHNIPNFKSILSNFEYISYPAYLKMRRKI